MYLRTIFELEEEGIVPLRARIAERLHQSGPTVSQTVARMEREGLLTVEGDRHLQLSEEGRRLGTAVMRQQRLARRLLLRGGAPPGHRGRAQAPARTAPPRRRDRPGLCRRSGGGVRPGARQERAGGT